MNNLKQENMKSTIEVTESKEQNVKYPCLKISEDGDCIALYISASLQRIIIHTDDPAELGLSVFDDSMFTVLPKGVKVILEND